LRDLRQGQSSRHAFLRALRCRAYDSACQRAAAEHYRSRRRDTRTEVTANIERRAVCARSADRNRSHIHGATTIRTAAR
jgi:hypothetical protein